MRKVFSVLMKGGIYIIQNNINGHAYVGSTVHFKRRFALHLHKLRKGKHHSPHLQNAWNKYGETAFSFMRLQFIDDKTHRLKCEQVFLDTLKPVYNVSKSATSCEGTKRSDAVRAKMRQAMVNDPRAEAFRRMARAPRPATHRDNIAAAKRGQRPSDETRAKLRAASRRRWGKTSKEMPTTPTEPVLTSELSVDREDAFK